MFDSILLGAILAASPPVALGQTTATILSSCQRGVAFLLTHQNRDGSWGAPTSSTDFDIMATPPGSPQAFRVAITALCVMALRRPATTDTLVAAARQRGIGYLLDRSDVKRSTPLEIYNIWSHGYAIQALSEEVIDQRASGRSPAAAMTALTMVIGRHLDRLCAYETMWGGWNYYDFNLQSRQPSYEPTSFSSAAILIGLHEAAQAGITIPDRLTARALSILSKCRKSDDSYLYSFGHRYFPATLSGRDKGSLGRSQVCNLALYLHQKNVTVDQLKSGLDRLFKEHKFIEIGRKRQYPHEAWYATAGYYYYFGHYYAGKILEYLPQQNRPVYAARLAAFIAPHQEDNGAWWDMKFNNFHLAYGTAFSLLALQDCLSSLTLP